MVEGEKSVLELLNSRYEIVEINASSEWLNGHRHLLGETKFEEASRADLERMSFFKTPSPVIALAKQIHVSTPDYSKKWLLALDGISDPGNLGTIIRIADWYGIDQILCSTDTVDLYNPKTISSTMGSFTRINVSYVNLPNELSHSGKVLWFALMDGESLTSVQTPEGGILVIGNEANGISEALLACSHRAITIPRIGEAESLNAAVATGILCERLVR